MILSKEECENCVGVFTDKICLSCPEEHCTVNCEVHRSENQLYEIIDEHFELVEKHEDLKEKAKELSNSNDELRRELYFIEPYKFEDLKPYMFVFDKEFNGWGEIVRIIETFINEYGEKLVRCFATGSDDIQIRSYKENRFFPVQMANVGCE